MQPRHDMKLDAHSVSPGPQETSGNHNHAASASPEISTTPDNMDAIPTQPCLMPAHEIQAPQQTMCSPSGMPTPPSSGALAILSSGSLQLLPAAPAPAQCPEPSDGQLQADELSGSTPLDLASTACGAAAPAEPDVLSQVADVCPRSPDDMHLGHALPAASAPRPEMRDAGQQAVSVQVADVEDAANIDALPAKVTDGSAAADISMDLDADFEALALAVQYTGDTQVYTMYTCG